MVVKQSNIKGELQDTSLKQHPAMVRTIRSSGLFSPFERALHRVTNRFFLFFVFFQKKSLGQQKMPFGL